MTQKDKSKSILRPKTTSQRVKNAGRPLFSPKIRTASAKIKKMSQRSKEGAKKTNSAVNKGRGNIKMWNRMSAIAQMKTPSFRFCPQQQVLQIQQHFIVSLFTFLTFKIYELRTLRSDVRPSITRLPGYNLTLHTNKKGTFSWIEFKVFLKWFQKVQIGS